MKSKLFFISISIIILIIGVGVYLIFSSNKGTASPKLENDKLESIDAKTKIIDSSNIKSVSSITNKDFVIKDKNNYIELSGKYRDLKTDEKIIKTVPANEKHIYDIYEFDNFKILIQPGRDANSRIGSIDLTTPVIQTSRGIIVGDTISQVVEKYGKADDHKIIDQTLPEEYVYRCNSEFMTFFVDKTGKVVLIRLELV